MLFLTKPEYYMTTEVLIGEKCDIYVTFIASLFKIGRSIFNKIYHCAIFNHLYKNFNEFYLSLWNNLRIFSSIVFELTRLYLICDLFTIFIVEMFITIRENYLNSRRFFYPPSQYQALSRTITWQLKTSIFFCLCRW